ncbi:unnamed protein product [Lupinus luteus]|uniref:Cation/H+ exchanger domain-containing protein n=1 Tax=Lupinus luteus TaxID=3873 RepID=A0AAV1XMB4_LUPLU
MDLNVDDPNNFTITPNENGTELVCFKDSISSGSSLWLDNSLRTNVPIFALQLAFILALNRLFLALSKSSHVPRIVVNIFAGMIMGPSFLGQWEDYRKTIFPFHIMMPVETVAGLTLVYYVFLIGLEADLKTLRRCRKKSIILAISGTIFTVPIGFGLYYLLLTNFGSNPMPPSHRTSHFHGAMIWGFTLSCSEFREIAYILSDLKLLLTENGQLALTASLINDLINWIFLPVAINEFCYDSIIILTVTILIGFACWYIFHPGAEWILNKIGTRDKEFIETEVVFLLHLVLVFGLISDGLGAHSITGAYFLGLIIPKGMLSDTIQDKVLDFVADFMMPLFFAVIGQRMKIDEWPWMTVIVVVVMAFIAKILSTSLVFFINRMPLVEGLTVGLLMNTKGIVSIIILNSARNKLELNSTAFGVMLLTCWLMTVPVGPVLAATKTFASNNFLDRSHRRTMQGTRPDSPLRVLACVHTKRDANVIINLLKESCPSVKSPIQVIAVELIKMTKGWSHHAASSLIIKDAHKPSFSTKSSRSGSFKDDNNDNNDTLGSFDNLTQAIFVEKMRILSSYKSMHKDIFNLAKQRGVTLILTTIYKEPTYDGLGAGAATARAANIVNRDRASKDKKKVVLENLVEGTPCCLAIFVDRGFGQKRAKVQKLAMLYVAGLDDREALSYAWRMSRNPEAQLTVVRLVWDNPNDQFDETDEQCLTSFVRQTLDTPWVKYMEKTVKNEKETVTLLNKVANKGFDLFIIGRGNGRKMSLAQTEDPVLEEPALGPLGDTLSDLNSAAKTSILILQ